MAEANQLTIRLYACKALIARGEAQGFTTLISMIEANAQDSASTGGGSRSFTELYGTIITKSLSKKWLTKERGYKHIFRFYEQRLFNQVYPVLEKYREISFGVLMIMQSCSLVPLSMV